MLRPILVLLSVVLLSVACSEDDESPSTALFVRVENLNDFELTDVVLTFPDGNTEVYDSVEKLGISRYRAVGAAAEVIRISLRVDGELYQDTPSYDGQDLLPDGNYTYGVTVDTENKTITVEFSKRA